jgi:hypothetical protein
MLASKVAITFIIETPGKGKRTSTALHTWPSELDYLGS